MGSWNATCQISQLPILSGEPVRVLFLQRNPWSMDPPGDLCLGGMNYHSKERCYSTDYWVPRNIPLRAVYDDYGGVEDVEPGVSLDTLWEQFQHDLIPIPEGENEYHQPSSFVGMDWEHMWWVAIEGRLRVNARVGSISIDSIDVETGKIVTSHESPRAVPVCAVLVREDVWKMVTGIVLTDWNTSSVDTVLQEILEKARSIRETLEKTLSAPKYEPGDYRNSFEFLNDILFHSMTEELFQMGSFRNRGLSFAFKRLVQKEVPESDPAWRALAEIIHVNEVMGRPLRKTWGPQSGAGSQSQDFDVAGNFYRGLVRICETLDKRFDDDNDSTEGDL